MKPARSLRWGQARKERRERLGPPDRDGDGEAPFVEEAFNAQQAAREALRRALGAFREEARRRGELLRFGIPVSWHAARRWRCTEGHVSPSCASVDWLGTCCPARNCNAPVFLSFPTDVTGPLPETLP